MFVQVSETSFILFSSITKFTLEKEDSLFITVKTGEIYEIKENAQIVFNNLYKYSCCLLLDGTNKFNSN